MSTTPPSTAHVALCALDMAGTTVADDGAVEAAFAEALEAASFDPDRSPVGDASDYVRATMGMSKITVFTEAFGGDRAAAQTANAAFEDAYGRAIARGDLAPIPGATDALARLRADGIAVCLTTGFSPPTRDALLDALGWRDVVDLALSPADAGGRGRPWPDMVLVAVLRLGIDDVHRVAVVGDTANDLLSGWRAGAGTLVGVLSGAHGRPELEAGPHTHIIGSVAELPDLLIASEHLPAGTEPHH